MAVKGGTKILAIFTICIILVTIGFSGCFGDDDGKENDKNEYICSYRYQIEINSSSYQYELNVPLPVYGDENRNIHVSPIIEDLKIVQGNVSFEIENTLYGPSLKIIGKGYALINLSGNDLSKYLVHNRGSHLFLSMAKD